MSEADVQTRKTKRTRTESHQPPAPPTLLVPAPIALILAGVPGSGKSTFSHALMQRSTLQPWECVNQDTIREGRSGTREQCLQSMAAALKERKNVIIDRTNVTPEQRQPFIQVAREHGARKVYCVVLQLPSKVCGARAAARTDHAGGVQGPAAYGIVGKMNKSLVTAGPPQLTEGLDAVLVRKHQSEKGESMYAIICLFLSFP